MSEQNNSGKDKIIQVLSEELEHARQGRINNLLLITTGEDYVSKRAEVFTHEGQDKLLQRLKEMEQWLLESKATGEDSSPTV